VLYGLPPGMKGDGKQLKDVADELDAIRAKYPNFDMEAALAQGAMTLAQLNALASTFDVWTVPELGALARSVSMNWIRAGDDTFRLQYPWGDGTEVLNVAKDLLGHFDISVTLRPTDPSGTVRQRTLAAQVPEADWHSDPPTEKQIAILQRIGAPLHRHLTKGEASRMISLHQARRGPMTNVEEYDRMFALQTDLHAQCAMVFVDLVRRRLTSARGSSPPCHIVMSSDTMTVEELIE
jgi:hypothetical protein